MSSKQITDLAKQMAEMMQGLIEQGAQARVKELLDGVIGGKVASAPRAARTSVAAPSKTATASTGGKKKRNYQRKPCPVPNCSKLAAPRHSMVCIDHKDLSQHEKDQFKAMANAPGGKWYKERRELAQGKRKSAAAA